MNQKVQSMDEVIQLRKKISELEQNERLFKEAEKTGKIGGWQFDPATLKQTWTDEVFRILEINLEHGAPEVPSGLEFIDPEFRTMAEKAIRRAMEHGESYDQEWMVTTAKGNKKWVNAVCSPVMKQGKLISVSGSFQDITDRKKTENALKIREAILKRTEQIAHVGSWEWDVASDSVTWSDELFQIFRLNPENGAVSYADHAKIYKPESMHRLDKAVQHTLETGEPYDIDLEIIRGDGTNAFCSVRGFAKKDEKGRLVRLYGSFQDITDRKKAEDLLVAVNQQLNANEQQLKAANQQLRANEQQLLASNQQLMANEQQLRAANQQLIASEQQLVAANQQLKASEQLLKEANKRIRESEKQFRQLFENMEQGFALHEMIYDKDGKPIDYRFLLINKAFEKLTGINATDYIGKTAKQVIPGLEQIWIENYGKVAKTGKSMQFEHYSKEFDKYYNVISYSPEKDFFATIFTDTTQDKLFLKQIIEAKERAERNELELKKVQKITHVGSWYVDTKSNEVSWTEELYKLYGFDPSLPVPPYSEHMKLFTPESWELLSSSLENIQKTGIPYEFELRTVRDDKSIGWMWVRGEARFDENKNLVGLWGAAQDISERKNIEIELQIAKERAEEADRLKSAFLANMSHEIRTPMNGILGFTSLLREPNLSGEDQQKYIEIIQKSGDRMLSTVNDIIDISRIESGQVEISTSEIDIIEKLKYLYEFFKPEAAKKGLQLTFKNNTSSHAVRINTDNEKFDSILTNLIKNAIKFTNQGKIELGYHLKTENETALLEFYVKDTGIGIPKDKQTTIFDRFVQADIEDKQAKQGSGLGLAIAKAYVEMLGGEISVYSEGVGKGTTFHFTIPYHPETDLISMIQNNGQLLKDDNIDRKLKILVVEDDETSKELISILVNKFAKEIIAVNSGMEAIEVCRDKPDIDLIMMDIQLPHINGHKATSNIRQFNKKVVIIAQTAYALQGDKEKALEAGCNDFISKPVNKDELYSLMKKYFDT